MCGIEAFRLDTVQAMEGRSFKSSFSNAASNVSSRSPASKSALPNFAAFVEVLTLWSQESQCSVLRGRKRETHCVRELERHVRSRIGLT